MPEKPKPTVSFLGKIDLFYKMSFDLGDAIKF